MIRWTKTKVRVYSDSVSCFAKMSDHSEANRRWEGQVEQFRQSNSYRELLGIDGEPFEFECNILQGLTSFEILQKIQRDLQDRNIEPEKSEDRIIFMSMFNDVDWTKRGHSERCFKFRTSQEVREEILARTLDIPRPWRCKEVVLNSQLCP